MRKTIVRKTHGTRTTQDQRAVIARDNEYDPAVLVALSIVVSDNECLLNQWKLDAIVDNANESSSEWIDSFIRCQLVATEASGVDDDLRAIHLQELVLALEEITRDALSDQSAPFRDNQGL